MTGMTQSFSEGTTRIGWVLFAVSVVVGLATFNQDPRIGLACAAVVFGWFQIGSL